MLRDAAASPDAGFSMPFILPPLGSSRPRMRATTSPLVAAASSLDLNALLSAKRPALLETDAEGHTVLHALLVTMFSEKGGQIARLVDWRANTSRRTIYRYDVLRAVARQARPAIHRILQTAPELAKRASPRFGVTPLHLAAHHGVPSLVSALLSAGADAAAVSSGGRTPVDEAMHNGNFEALALLLAALPPAASAEARRRVAEYAALPGAALREVKRLHLPAVPRRAPMAEGADDGAAAAACDATGGWGAPLGGAAGEAARSAQWGRDIDLRTAALSESELYESYHLASRPLLLHNAIPLAERCALAATAPAFRADATQRRFACGATAYPEITGRERCGSYTMLELIGAPTCTDEAKTPPVCNWKLAAERQQSQMAMAKRRGGLLAGRMTLNDTLGFRQMPARLRHGDGGPPLPALGRAWLQSTSRSLWGGSSGSGSGFHYHNSAYNVLFFGTKHWVLTPPRYAGITDLPADAWPDADAKAALPDGLPLRFTQHAGDLVIVPPQWGHSTLSDGFTLGLGVLWCDHRWVNVTGGQCHKDTVYDGAKPRTRAGKGRGRGRGRR